MITRVKIKHEEQMSSTCKERESEEETKKTQEMRRIYCKNSRQSGGRRQKENDNEGMKSKGWSALLL